MKSKFFSLLSASVLSLILLSQPSNAQTTVVTGAPGAEHPSFEDWLSSFKMRAEKAGISQGTIVTALDGLKPIPKVLEYDKKQPEFTRTLWVYLRNGVSDKRIQRGRQLLKKHGKLFAKLQSKYGVQPRFLVAFWGLETNFGDYTGGFPVIGSLATLAHDPRRSEFFSTELLHALSILDAGHIQPDKMLGSWAGAMGQTQFMPSTFVQYAADGDQDNKVDIWGSLPDVMTSSSNYLSQIGWKGDETWGREVRLPKDFDLELADTRIRKSLSEWQQLGVRKVNGQNLPQVTGMEASVILPAGHKGPAFLVYNNFRKIMIWNRSILYALTVGHLADRLAGLGPLKAKQPEGDRPLSRDDIIALQAALETEGFNPGPADGIMGSKTRKALKQYQKREGLPVDGYPTSEIVARITLKKN